MSTPIYFRSLAARCRTSARNCSDHFAQEEFRRLAHEFDAKADQLERSNVLPIHADWWPTSASSPADSRGMPKQPAGPLMTLGNHARAGRPC